MRLLSFTDLKEKKGLPWVRRHIERLVVAGEFPRPVHIGSRVAFVETEIDAWIAERAALRDAPKATA